MFLSVAVGIGAVLLLANDRQNLKALGRWAGVDLSWGTVQEPHRPPEPLKGQPETIQPTMLPDRVMHEPDMEAVGAFVREMRDLGPAFCAAFDAAGINNEGWRESPFGGSTFECLSEDLIKPLGEEGPSASFFFIAKGRPDGEINSIRMKLVAPDTEAGRASHDKLVSAITTLMHQTGWSDLAPLLDSARSLADYTSVRFGMSYKFNKEFTASDRYNLIILPMDRDPAVVRSRDYFDQAKWMPVPPLTDDMLRLTRRST
ncbi:DUF6030 family protein [Pseudomonas sp. R2.Fl]|nr:DUF6030 family protein [Pseudomonas sp. R2.Fl]